MRERLLSGIGRRHSITKRIPAPLIAIFDRRRDDAL